MALKLAIRFPFLAPSLDPNTNSTQCQPHRPSTEVWFSRWNNANADRFNLRRSRQQEIEDDIRRERRFESANKIANMDDASTPTSSAVETFRSIGTPSAPSRPSIPGKKSKYSKTPKPTVESHPAFRFSNIPNPRNRPAVRAPANVKIGEDGVSYVIDGAPFEFKYSYTETPKSKPMKMREPPFVPFGPTTMPRPWTGRAPLPQSKKKLKEFDSFVLPPPHKKGVKPVQKPGPFLPGTRPRYVQSREEILGEPLTQEEIDELIKGSVKTTRQLNIGRDGLTHNMLDNIHAHWKRRRVCKIKCKGVCTVDMDNVCQQLEERTGGKIIYRKGGVVYLFRGRNYNYKTRPRFPLMLWKPVPPVYPRLIERAPEGLTLEEATEMRKRGRKLIPIRKLAKNGVYCDLVKNVKEAFEECELVRINCQGMNPSDFRKIGAKLRDLVPCVLLSFENEHILMWRGQNWISALPNPKDDCEEANKSDVDIKNSDIVPSEAQEEHVSHEAHDNSISPSSGDVSIPKVEVPYPTEDSILSVSAFTDATLLVKRSDEGETTTEFPGSYGESDPSMSPTPIVSSSDYNSCTKGTAKVIIDNDETKAILNGKECNDGLSASILASDTVVGTGDDSSNAAEVDPVPCTKGILLLLEQAVERGSALILDDESLEADNIYRRSVALAKSAPPEPEFRRQRRKVVAQKSDTDTDKQEIWTSDTEEMLAVSMKGREKSDKIRRKGDFDEHCLNHNSAVDANHKGRSPVTDPHWDHEATFDVLGDQSEVDVTVYDRSNQEAFLGHVRLSINLREDHSRLEGWFPLVARGAGDTQVSGEIHLQMRFEMTDRKNVGPNDFQILKLIGKGTFGQVYQVKKKDTERIYAMKVLSKKVIIQKKEIAHTLGERNILVRTAMAASPFIVGLKFSFQTPTDLYLVTDYMSGGELFWHLQREGRFQEARAKFYIAELILALQHLHDHDIVYRDLKPENILLDANGHIALCDFGLSKANLTQNDTTNTFCGTTEYLAPEVLLDEQGYTKMVDFWSLGVLVFEMCCGWSPFYAEDTQQMYKNIAFGKVRFPRDALSTEGRNFVKGLLNRNPKHRLGAEGDAKQLMEHPFFHDIDWDALCRKQVIPPFKPKLQSDTDTSNFDPEFTNALENNNSLNLRAAALANGLMPGSTPLSPGMQANFKGFTFVNESSIDHHLKNEPDEMDEDSIHDGAWQRTHRPTNSTDQRMSGVQKTADGTEPGIFNVDDNFDM